MVDLITDVCIALTLYLLGLGAGYWLAKDLKTFSCPKARLDTIDSRLMTIERNQADILCKLNSTERKIK